MVRASQWFAGLALLAGGFYALARARDLGPALFGSAMVVGGAVVLATRLAPWVAAPFLRFIDGIYLPGGAAGGDPPPNYRLARYYIRSRQLDLAIAEYRKILAYHPSAAEAYIALFDVLANHKGMRAQAARLYRRGLRKVGGRSDRRRLREAYGDGEVAPFELDPDEEVLGGTVKFPKLRS